ncbi:Uncharacterised protein [Mycobacteroides abscessus subsp. abscessus]|nr:Uncharacterised protein [Mycobacteroides abscessus subsp. abscessus]
MQSWPALYSAASAISCATASTSTSLRTMTGQLPPSSRCSTFNPAARVISCPARTLPVSEIRAGMRCATMYWPVSRPPNTALTTPGGNVSLAIAKRARTLHGVGAAGLRTDVLPIANAGASLEIADANG